MALIHVAVLRDGRNGLGTERTEAATGTRWLVFPNDSTHLVEACLSQRFLVERRLAGEQFVEQHAKRINITACIDILAAEVGLLWAHVQRSAHELGMRRID